MKCDFLSASGANLYEQCPLRFHARYELGKKSGSTPAIGAGLIAHKALELYYRPDCKISEEDCFQQAIKEESCANREQFEEARNMFFETIKKEPKEQLNVITTELSFEFYLESGSAARGFIDRVDLINANTIRLVDYKSGQLVPTLDELEQSHQTNIYAAYIFLEDKFSGIDNVIFNYKYIRTGQEKTVKISRAMAYRYLEYFDHLFQAIVNNKSPKPTINSFCWNCEHRGECSEYLNNLKVIFAIKSACGLGNETVNNVEETLELPPEDVIDVYSTVSTVSSCIEKEKKTISSWITAMLKNISNGKLESKTNIAKLTTRPNGACWPTITKKKG